MESMMNSDIRETGSKRHGMFVNTAPQEVEDAELSCISTTSWDSGVDLSIILGSPCRGRSLRSTTTVEEEEPSVNDFSNTGLPSLPQPSHFMRNQNVQRAKSYSEQHANTMNSKEFAEQLTRYLLEAPALVRNQVLGKLPESVLMSAVHNNGSSRMRRQYICRPDSPDPSVGTKSPDSLSMRLDESIETDKNYPQGTTLRDSPRYERPDEDKIDMDPKVPIETMSPTKIWNTILPWLLSNFDEIMGERNTGAIDFLRQGQKIPSPTICITAENPLVVNRKPIDKRLRELTRVHFEIEVRGGLVRRTADGGRSWHGRSENRWPAANPSFNQIASCGSSIGVSGSSDIASFGGILQLKFGHPTDNWELCGLTCHHLLEERTADTQLGRGVRDGLLHGKMLHISQPAEPHLDAEKYRLNRYLCSVKAIFDNRKDTLRYEELLYMDEQKKRLSLDLALLNGKTKKHFYLGRVISSSGYGTSKSGHQMDWALIDDIPEDRCPGYNVLPGGNVSTLLYDVGQPVVRMAGDELFESIGELYEDMAQRHQTVPEPIGRIHGFGAITGQGSGYLSGTRSIVRLGAYDAPSLEWSFAPYGSLGTQGDSGAWIFNDFGAVVGMIFGRNEERNLTYFTPMHLIMQDIKDKTGAIDVRLARDESKNYTLLPCPVLQHAPIPNTFWRTSQCSTVSRDSGIDISSSGRSSCGTSIRSSPRSPEAAESVIWPLVEHGVPTEAGVAASGPATNISAGVRLSSTSSITRRERTPELFRKPTPELLRKPMRDISTGLMRKPSVLQLSKPLPQVPDGQAHMNVNGPPRSKYQPAPTRPIHEATNFDLMRNFSHTRGQTSQDAGGTKPNNTSTFYLP